MLALLAAVQQREVQAGALRQQNQIRQGMTAMLLITALRSLRPAKAT